MRGRPLVYDLTRTFVGPLFATPRGVDRVDFLLARHFSQDLRRDFFGILPTPWGMRIYEADRVRRGLARLEELWAETKEPADDLAYQNLVGALAGRGCNPRRGPRNTVGGLRKGRRMASLLAATGFSFGRPAITSIPENAIYLNVGQYTIAIPQFMAWLNKRRDVRSALMLHDTIPLYVPELVSHNSARTHVTMVRSVARYGAGLIVTTAHARETILRALAAEGRSGIRTLSVALPLAETFDLGGQAGAAPQQHPVFRYLRRRRTAQESFTAARCLATALRVAGTGASSSRGRHAGLAWTDDPQRNASLPEDPRQNPPCRGAFHPGHEVAHCRFARPAVSLPGRGVRTADHRGVASWGAGCRV